MEVNKNIDKKSIKFLRGKQTNRDELGKDCVCFANTQGGFIYIGIDNSATVLHKNWKIEEIKKSNLQKELASDQLAGREVIL